MEGSGEPARSGRGLALTFVDGRAVLAVQGRALPSLGRADRLELEIPAVRFAFDMSGGVSRLASRRCRLRELALSAGRTEVAEFLRSGHLADFGIFDARATVIGGELRVEAQARLGRHEAGFTVRGAVRPVHPRRARISLYDVRVYGFLPVSAPMLASALFTPGGAAAQARPEASSGGVAAAAPLLWLDGPTDLELELVELALLEMLPGQGWRMPERGQVRPMPAGGDEGRVALRYGWSESSGERAEGSSVLDAYDQSRQRHADAEAALARGEIGRASAAYRKARPVAAGDPWASARLLQLLSAGASTAAEAAALATDALARWPGFVPALLAQAAAASEAGQPAEAAQLYQQVADLSVPPAPVGSVHATDTIDRACALVAVARERERAADPTAALVALEQAVALSPGHHGAHRALVQRLTADARWSDLVRVIIQRAVDEDDPADRAALQAEAGFAYLDRLGDRNRARDCFEQAVQLAPDQPAGWDGLGRLDLRRVVERDWARGNFARVAELGAGLVHKPEARQLAGVELMVAVAATITDPGSPAAQRLAARVPRVPARSEVWRPGALDHPLARGPLRRVLRALARPLAGFAPISPDAVAAAGLPFELPARLAELQSRLEAPPVRVVSRAQAEGAVVVLGTRPVTVVLRAGVVGTGPVTAGVKSDVAPLGARELDFLVARALDDARAGTFVVRALGERQLDNLLRAVAAVLGGAAGTGGALEDGVVAWLGDPATAALLPPGQRRAELLLDLQEVVAHPVDREAFLRGCRFSADRVAVLACGELPAALRAMAAGDGGTIAAEPVRELVAFLMSAECRALGA